ncbi:MAG: RluA family pseudouridine synthase [Spirochaetota bacterium]
MEHSDNTHTPRRRIIESVVRKENDGRALCEYLASRFSYLNTDQWLTEIEEGRLVLNGAAPDPDTIISAGDRIAYDGRNIVEPDVDRSYTILYEDEFFIAVDKPGDLPVHPSGRYFNNTLTMILEEKYGTKIYPVHRLDRETSGIILLTTDSAAAGELSGALPRGQKEYQALVKGRFPEEPFTVNLPLGPDRNSPVRKKRAAYEGAPESACTHFICQKRMARYSLVRALPETGRLHQIRAHLESAGYPILGDKIYGGDPALFLRFIETGMTPGLAEKLILPRCALHASRLTFIHPRTQKELSISAPLPKMFAEFITRESADG